MKSKSHRKIGLSLTLVVLGLLFAKPSQPLDVSAVSPMPTNVNVSINTDSQVNSYYSGVSGLSGNALLGALNQIIDGHNEYDYDSTTHRTIYKIIDRNWDLSPLTPSELANFDYANDNPFIHKLYADYNDSALTADRFKNDGATRVSFDKEHIWAQSLGDFGRDDGAGSDFHALWPSDVKGNQQAHSNYNFATPTTNITNYLNDYDTYVGRNGYMPGSSEKVFEPLDQYKGDIARAMFYMPARYFTYEDATHPKLQLTNGSPAALIASPSQPGLAGDLETLLEWNKLDPVDDYEIKRNNLIHNNYQGNRNPFIDHPEWADIAYDASYSGDGATIAAETSSVGTSPAWQTPEQTLESISLNTAGATLSFEVGEAFNLTGLIVTAQYDDESSKAVTSYSSSISAGYIFENTGSISITISYTEFGVTKTASYSITITAATKTLTHISLNTTSVQTSFTFKETFNHDNLVVTAHYDDDSSQSIYNYSISTPTMDAIGSQSISISYLAKSASYGITITNNNADFGTLRADDLFFSEYIEGSSNNKSIELYNGTGNPIDLSGYSIKLFSNGSSTASSTLSLSGTINNEGTYVISNSSANTTILAITDVTSGVANFNGDDALGLYKNDVLIDRFGQIGFDPGTSWSSGGVATVDKTLVRKPSVSSGDVDGTSSFDPSLEWTQYAIDTTSYLGSHNMNDISTSDAYEQSLAYAVFFLELTGPYCQELDGGNVDWDYLSDEYGYMADLSKDRFYSETIEDDIAAAKERYEYLIDKYPMLAANNFVKNSAGTPYFSTSSPSISTMNQASETNAIYWIVTLLFVVCSFGVIYYLKKPRIIS